LCSKQQKNQTFSFFYTPHPFRSTKEKEREREEERERERRREREREGEREGERRAKEQKKNLVPQKAIVHLARKIF
jgi:hypothetical protein